MPVFLLLFVAAALSLAMQCGGDKPARDVPVGTATPFPRTAADEEAAQAFEPGGILGLRCSYASKFLRTRYGLSAGAGCVILRVDDHSGAQKAGLQVGDRIVRLGDTPITSGRQFTWFFEDVPGPQRRAFVVQRGDKQLELKVILGARADLPIVDPYADYLTARGNSSDLTALMYFTRAIEQEPNFDLAYAYRGALYGDSPFLEMNDRALAEADYLKALELDPELPEANEHYGSFLAWTRGAYTDALAHLGRAADVAKCVAPLAPWDYDCGQILLSRAEVYRRRGLAGDEQLAATDIEATGLVVGVTERRQSMSPEGVPNAANSRQEGTRCTRDGDIVVPCSLLLSDKRKYDLPVLETDVRAILDDFGDEPMNEVRFSLAQLMANRGGDLTEVIDQLTLAYSDLRCGVSFFDMTLCGKYVFARAESYLVRGAAGDVDLAIADLTSLAQYPAWQASVTKALAGIDSGQ